MAAKRNASEIDVWGGKLLTVHAWGMHIERTAPADPVVKKPSQLAQLEAENARLRALLAAHGIDPS